MGDATWTCPECKRETEPVLASLNADGWDFDEDSVVPYDAPDPEGAYSGLIPIYGHVCPYCGYADDLWIDGNYDAGPGLRARVAELEAREGVLGEVSQERDRQDAKWGADRNLPDGTGSELRHQEAIDVKAMCRDAFDLGVGTWLVILDEEVREAFAESDPAKLRDELIQVSAVAVAWIEAIDRRSGGG